MALVKYQLPAFLSVPGVYQAVGGTATDAVIAALVLGRNVSSLEAMLHIEFWARPTDTLRLLGKAR